ncbi:hypothetical protein FRC14_004205 [Serendipita sp. 396]|nr:hypothetical protein FRC14_004205 [Serendipita sp. 396]
MYIRALFTNALALSAVVLRVLAAESTPDESVGTTEVNEEPIFKVSATFPEDNPFSRVYIDDLGRWS